MEVAFRDCVAEARDRGQSVFLSSHILSEVEALCDRVGILRAGKLVDEGTLSQLRHLSAQTVDVGFESEIPNLPPLEGVTASVTGLLSVRYEVTGKIGPLIEALSGSSIATMTSREPSLEEIFVHHYRQPSADVGS
jgi:ABC-2 type transport system ATP-binding protein